MEVEALDILVGNGVIKSYTYDDADDEGNIGKVSHNRNTQVLIIEFNSGQKLQIDSFCAGSSQDSVLSFELLKK